jgi:hypothetical protein
MENYMEIKQVKIASCEQDVVILGQLTTGNFNYQSSVVINVGDLNRLINHLQKLNPNHEISAMFTSNVFPDGTEYELNTNSLEHKTISLFDIANFSSVRKICA